MAEPTTDAGETMFGATRILPPTGEDRFFSTFFVWREAKSAPWTCHPCS